MIVPFSSGLQVMRRILDEGAECIAKEITAMEEMVYGHKKTASKLKQEAMKTINIWKTFYLIMKEIETQPAAITHEL